MSSAFVKGRVLASSAGRRWRGVAAELRYHPAGERPGQVLAATEIAVMVRGTSIVNRQGEGIRQRVVCSPGMIGLTPAGFREDVKQVDGEIAEMLHIHLPPDSFAALALRASERPHPLAVEYEAGFRDALIECIATEVLRELRFETACGDLLVGTLADALAVRLFSRFSDPGSGREGRAAPQRALDDRRLRRVMEYIDANLQAEITIDDLASVAALSRFHFSRMFKAATGHSPNRFVGQRRMEMAKEQLSAGEAIAVVAFACGFSSDSNFARAFHRVTGFTPSRYRELARGSRKNS